MSLFTFLFAGTLLLLLAGFLYLGSSEAKRVDPSSKNDFVRGRDMGLRIFFPFVLVGTIAFFGYALVEAVRSVR